MLVELLSIHEGASSLGNVQVEDNVTPKSGLSATYLGTNIFHVTHGSCPMVFVAQLKKVHGAFFFGGGSQDP